MIKLLVTSIVLLLTTSAFAGSVGISHKRNKKSDSTLNSYIKSVDFADSVLDTIDLAGNYNYGETGDVVATDDGMLSIGYSPEVTKRWSLWVRETASYDETIGIDFENIIGFGPKYTLYNNEEKGTNLSLSAGILYHSTSVDSVHSSDDRYSYRVKFTNSIVRFVYYKQPSIKNSKDYISTVDCAITLVSFDRLSVKIFYKEKYRSIYKDTASTEGTKLSLDF